MNYELWDSQMKKTRVLVILFKVYKSGYGTS